MVVGAHPVVLVAGVAELDEVLRAHLELVRAEALVVELDALRGLGRDVGEVVARDGPPIGVAPRQDPDEREQQDEEGSADHAARWASRSSRYPIRVTPARWSIERRSGPR